MDQMNQLQQNPMVLAILKRLMGVADPNAQPFTNPSRAQQFQQGSPQSSRYHTTPGVGAVRGEYAEAANRDKNLPCLKDCTGFK